MGRSQQRKGKSGELELVSYFNERGYETRRGASRSYGTEPDVIGLPGIHVEVKRVEKLNLSEAMAQAVRDSERFHDGVPVVFHRRNREGWLVTMRLEDWMIFYKKGDIKMLNQIIVMGRLVRDPEMRYTQANVPVTSFTIAVDRDFGKTESGSKVTDFIDCVAWNNTAEYVKKFASKGRLVVVSGRLQFREWIDKNENKRRNAEVMVADIYFGDSRNAAAESKDEALDDKGELPF